MIAIAEELTKILIIKRNLSNTQIPTIPDNYMTGSDQVPRRDYDIEYRSNEKVKNKLNNYI